MVKHCPRCSNAVEMKTLDRVSAEDAPLKLTVTGMPAAKCAKGHAAPIDRDFMLWLIQELKSRGGALAAGEAKGMVFKKYTCGCGKELDWWFTEQALKPRPSGTRAPLKMSALPDACRQVLKAD